MKELLSLLVRISGSPNELIPISHSEYQNLVSDIWKNIPYQEEVRAEYLGKVKKFIEEVTYIRMLKALKGCRISENSFDKAVLSAVQKLLKIYNDIMGGKIMLNSEGETVVKVLKNIVANKELLGTNKIPTRLYMGDIILMPIDKAIPLYLLGIVSFESNT